MTVIQTINSFARKIPTWPLYVLGVVPLAVLFYWGATNQLGADPLRAIERQSGRWALQLLIATLLITPVRNICNLNLIKFRRAVGLMAFYYVCFHLTIYLWLDQQWLWDVIVKDITKRPYIMFGMAAFLVLLPLAITSNNWSIRRLGPLVWRRLHWGVYFAVISGATHFTLLRKTWQLEPLVYLLIFVVLVGYRFVRIRRRVLA